MSGDKQQFADDLFNLASAVEVISGIPEHERACAQRCSHGGVCTKQVGHVDDHASLRDSRKPDLGAYCTWTQDAEVSS